MSAVVIPDVRGVLAGSGALTAIVGDKIYRTQAKDGTVPPYVVWSIVSAVPELNLSDTPEIDNSRIQIDCYAPKDSQSTGSNMMRAAMQAIEAVTDVVFGPVETREDETLYWRWVFDCSVWSPR